MSAQFLAGSICTLFFVVAVHFFKFWKKTNDGLFRLFALAFVLLGIERFLIAAFIGRTTISYVYLVRLLAFLLIIIAFVRKNKD